MKVITKRRKNLTNSSTWIMIRQFRQGNRAQMRMMSFVFALLLLFLHIFVLSSTLAGHVANGIKDKLGVYFYVKEAAQIGTGTTPEQVTSRVVKLKDELEKGGVDVTYYSKEDALKNLQKRLPGMVKSLDQYGIDNPLPITLYVTFKDQKQYDFVMQTQKGYEDILLTATGTNGNIENQYDRNVRVINVLHVLQGLFRFIIVACIVVTLVFLGLIIKTRFTAMNHTIQVQKLLGSQFNRLKKPFIFNSFLLLSIGYVMTVIMSAILISNLASIFPYLFGMTLAEVFGSVTGLRLIWLFVEFIVLLGIARIYANWQLNQLLKKQH